MGSLIIGGGGSGGGGAGTPGAPGKDNYQLALENGFVGTLDQYLASLKGAPGTKMALGDVALIARHMSKAGLMLADGSVLNSASYPPALVAALAVYNNSSPIVNVRSTFGGQYSTTTRGAVKDGRVYVGYSNALYHTDGLDAPTYISPPGFSTSTGLGHVFDDGGVLRAFGYMPNHSYVTGDSKLSSGWTATNPHVFKNPDGTDFVDTSSALMYGYLAQVVRLSTGRLVALVWSASYNKAFTLYTDDPARLIWTVVSVSTTGRMRSLAANPADVIVQVGAGGVWSVSEDSGATWVTQNSRTTQELHDVSWDGARFVAGGAGGRLVTSADGKACNPGLVSSGMAAVYRIRKLPSGGYIAFGGNYPTIDNGDRIKYAPSLSGPWTDVQILSDATNGAGGGDGGDIMFVGNQMVASGVYNTGNGYLYPAFLTGDAPDMSATQFRLPRYTSNQPDASFYIKVTE